LEAYDVGRRARGGLRLAGFASRRCPAPTHSRAKRLPGRPRLITTSTSIVTTSLAASAVVGQMCMVAGARASTFAGTIASVLTGERCAQSVGRELHFALPDVIIGWVSGGAVDNRLLDPRVGIAHELVDDLSRADTDDQREYARASASPATSSAAVCSPSRR
jgi:hypothetical protein